MLSNRNNKIYFKSISQHESFLSNYSLCVHKQLKMFNKLYIITKIYSALFIRNICPLPVTLNYCVMCAVKHWLFIQGNLCVVSADHNGPVSRRRFTEGSYPDNSENPFYALINSYNVLLVSTSIDVNLVQNSISSYTIHYVSPLISPLLCCINVLNHLLLCKESWKWSISLKWVQE